MEQGRSPHQKDSGNTGNSPAITPRELDEARLQGIKRGFFQGVARFIHDLNSPFTALQTSVDLLERAQEKTSGQGVRTDLGMILSSLASLRTLLDHWQEALHHSSESTTTVDVYELARNLLNTMSIQHPNIKLQAIPDDLLTNPIEPSKPTLLIETEPFALQQILSELLDNAVDALEGVDHPAVFMEVTESDKEVMIRIDSNGVPVPEELRETLWKDFITTKTGHFGLGLGVVRYLLMKHGGSIRLTESELGGSAFRFTIRKRTHLPIGF